MIKRILLYIVLSTTVIGGYAQHESEMIHVVLLAGQSNMSGCGNFEALDLSNKEKLAEVKENILLMRNGKKEAFLAPNFSKYQLKKRGFGHVFGPELFLGLTLADQNPNQKYLFIKTSQGGTSLYGAWNPNWDAEKALLTEKGFKQDLQLYQNFIDHIKNGLKHVTDQGKRYKILGLLWMQGENDAAQEIAAIHYQENLELLIDKTRKELNISDLPFVIGQINSSYGKFKKQGPGLVRAAQQKVADNDQNIKIINTSMDVSWSDYPKHTDSVHYNTEGQKRLGTAFAKTLLKLNLNDENKK